MRAARLLAAAALLLAGCQTSQDRAPLLTLDQSACTDSLDLAKAQAVPLGGDESADQNIEYNAPCWLPGTGAKVSYGLFKLPQSNVPLIVDIASIPMGQTLFTPQAALLDESGAETRRFASDRFVFRNDQLTLSLRPAATERYLLVFSNPAMVGQDAGRIIGIVQANAVYTGMGTIMMYSGNETNRVLTHAYNGKLSVSARPVPVAR